MTSLSRQLLEIGVPVPPSRGERVEELCFKLRASIEKLLSGVPVLSMNFGAGDGPLVASIDDDFDDKAREGAYGPVWDKVGKMIDQFAQLQAIEAAAREGRITARTAPDPEWEIFWTVPVEQLSRFVQ